eukprot:scaffold713_cov17-Tisochrysis_lutea.AAC.1
MDPPAEFLYACLPTRSGSPAAKEAAFVHAVSSLASAPHLCGAVLYTLATPLALQAAQPQRKSVHTCCRFLPCQRATFL